MRDIGKGYFGRFSLSALHERVLCRLGSLMTFPIHLDHLVCKPTKSGVYNVPDAD